MGCVDCSADSGLGGDREREGETYSFALYGIRDLSIQITQAVHMYDGIVCRNFGGNFNSFMPFYSV